MSPSVRDARLLRWLAFAAGLASAVLVLIVLFLVRESWPVIVRYGLMRFLSDRSWHPTEGAFSLVPMLAASAATSALAIAVATPLGVAAAIFCRFYATGAIGRILHWMIVLLAGVPSVVLGLWGLTVIVPLILKIAPPGTSLLAGSLVLSLMTLPTIALTTEAALASLPSSYWVGAAALGLSREATIMNVAIPATKASIFAGVILASARALGETMAVLMVSGNVVQLPKSLFDPVRTLTANIALEMAYATGDHRASLFVSGLALTAVVLLLAAAARRSGGQVVHA
ncbi:MAG: phosphate ABC transporter permease subunit PstC [Hyphomicrobium sp.]|uniref:phosphate ABC transporter permease subunit PstC n=1 Tax=Hyphomicrobium sp. TaxID=82 RepID=UPI0025C3C996|nr:phosphate ABC transporter permease subunit PstC [Hyphomicrobium sp.]MBZ0208997.1 phosphate ABC transporter permease subunit PstC [Hyphomicrobium sp.]